MCQDQLSFKNEDELKNEDDLKIEDDLKNEEKEDIKMRKPLDEATSQFEKALQDDATLKKT